MSTSEEVLQHLGELGESDLEEQLVQIWSAFVSPYPADTLDCKVTKLRQDEKEIQK